MMPDWPPTEQQLEQRIFTDRDLQLEELQNHCDRTLTQIAEMRTELKHSSILRDPHWPERKVRIGSFAAPIRSAEFLIPVADSGSKLRIDPKQIAASPDSTAEPPKFAMVELELESFISLRLAHPTSATISYVAALVEDFGGDGASGCHLILEFAPSIVCDNDRVKTDGIQALGGQRFRFESIEFWFAEGYSASGTGSVQLDLVFLVQVIPLDRIGELLRLLFEVTQHYGQNRRKRKNFVGNHNSGAPRRYICDTIVAPVPGGDENQSEKTSSGRRPKH